MATLSQSLVIRAGCLNFAESSKLMASIHHSCTSKFVYHHDGIYVGRRCFYGDVSQSVTKSSNRNHDLKTFAMPRSSVDQTEHLFTAASLVDELEKVRPYRFRTEFGGQVMVLVGKRNGKYLVSIEVTSSKLSGKDNLVASWGVYRSDQDSKIKSSETPFLPRSSGHLALEVEFEAKEAPLYFLFLLKNPSDGSSGSEIRSHRKTPFCVPVGFDIGYPAPLGQSFSTDGSMNFAIFSRNAKRLVLCLYDDTTLEKPALELDLDPYVNRSGDIWHASIDGACNFVSYGYRCHGDGEGFRSGRVLLDPYAKIINSSIPNQHESGGLLLKYLGRILKAPTFNWDVDVHPNLPMEKLVAYRLNVMRFTEHKSSNLSADVAGTFLGVTSKLKHLKDLGINAVLLEPIFMFDEQKGPYFPCHFFSPTNLYGPSNGSVSTINSMKEMVKKLHTNGMEVLLEVVFTTTAEDGSLQGIDDSSYYYRNKMKELDARNGLNCNSPVVQQMILDSLRHWVTEFHVDGFSFVNASFLLRGSNGEYLSRPPLVDAIAFDPILSKTKIIADFWDPHDMVSREIQFPHWKKWAEMSMKFCSDVRNFLRGEAAISDLATRLCGSGDVFSDGRGPAFSFNYIARNFGLTLVDLVSFSMTASASELSWNCGAEGPTTKAAVLERRLKQIRNFLLILFVSLGVPVLNMGDECGQSSGGSPSYSSRKLFDWNALTTGYAIQITQFIAFLSSLRIRRCDLLQKRNFLKVENIEWHGSSGSPPGWEDPSCKFLAMALKADKPVSQSGSDLSRVMTTGDLFIAFNAANHPESIFLPPAPKGMVWHRLVDTALPFPGFFDVDGEPVPEQMAGLVKYQMKSHSCSLFEAKTPVLQQTS